MTCIPGRTWLEGVRRKDASSLITINRSLGRILSKGCLDASSDGVIEDTIRPHLELLLSSEDPQIRAFHQVASTLLHQLHRLKLLPLCISHFDLNQVNIMIDDVLSSVGYR